MSRQERPTRPEEQGRPAVVAVLLDAMDVDLATDLAGRGRMPVLADLLARGSAVRTEGPPGFYVGGLWPTFSASINAGRHGQHCYLQFDPERYEELPPPYDDGEGRPFWAALDEAGLRSLVLDVPRSIRAPMRHGTAIHDFALHDPLAPGFVTSPPDLADEIRQIAGAPDLDACDQWPCASTEDVAASLARMDARIERKTRLFGELLSRGRYDIGVLGFGDAHCAGHQFWHLHDAAHRRHDATIRAALGSPLEHVYASLDRALGEVLEALPDTCRRFVFLSHGMGPHYDGSHLLDSLLERLEPSLPGLRPLTIAEQWMRWRPTRNLAAFFRRGLRRRFPKPSVRGTFTVPNNEAWAGIRLNQVGRERRGRVRPESREDCLDLLVTTLTAIRNPGTGTAAFSEVRRVSEFAHGSRLDVLPDLVARWRRDGPFDALESPALGRVEGECRAHRTGDHRPAGLALLVEPGRRARSVPTSVDVADLAPTLCAWLGIPLTEVDGHPIEAWL